MTFEWVVANKGALLNSLGLVIDIVGAFFEFAVEHPYQPLHFTHGYTWAALFLIGAPWLMVEARERIGSWSRRAARTASLVAFLLLLTDNIGFFGLFSAFQLEGKRPGMYMTRDQDDVVHHLGALYEKHVMLVSQDATIGFMATVYTPFRAYRAHFFTPEHSGVNERQQAAYFKGRIEDPLLAGPLVVVANVADGNFTPPGSSRLMYTNPSFRVFKVLAGP